jgi:bifunctional UDP-N-acetylglucosamine pyrophosphorylase/glucosamine-1-phosphate N-acetyltransferase
VTDARLAAVVVLAAGEGTRMKSAGTPKVLHPLGGRTMLGHVVAAARALGPEHLVVVVGHGREQVTPPSPSSTPARRPSSRSSSTAPATRVRWPWRPCRR